MGSQTFAAPLHGRYKPVYLHITRIRLTYHVIRVCRSISSVSDMEGDNGRYCTRALLHPTIVLIRLRIAGSSIVFPATYLGKHSETVLITR